MPGTGIEPVSHVFQTRAVTNLAILALITYLLTFVTNLAAPFRSLGKGGASLVCLSGLPPSFQKFRPDHLSGLYSGYFGGQANQIFSSTDRTYIKTGFEKSKQVLM